MKFIDKVVHHIGVEKFPKLKPAYKRKELLRYAKDNGIDSNAEVTFVIEEKLDGANARIYKMPGQPVLRVYSRSTLVGEVRSEEDFDGDFRGLVPYVARHYDFFINSIPDDHMIYGEWLVKHSVVYPEWMYGAFYAFPATEAGIDEIPATKVLGTISVKLNATEEEHQKFIKKLDDIVTAAKVDFERDVEGVVLYLNGKPAFKFVPERLQEKSVTTKKSKSGNNTRDFEVPDIPEQTLTKRFHDMLDRLNLNSADEIEGKSVHAAFGILSSMVWEDFVREILPDAILSKKNKGIHNINLKELRSMVNDDVRRYLQKMEVL